MSQRLMIQKGRNAPFHPRLFMAPDSGYKRFQWCGVYFRPDVHCGEEWAGNEVSLADLIEHYFKELARMDHKPVEWRG
jgi:hypothetical protein